MNLFKWFKEKWSRYQKWNKETAQESVNVRVIKFGSRYRQGIPYQDLEARYAKDRPNDWKAIKQMLGDAHYNYHNNGGRVTPFVLFEEQEPRGIDNCTYILHYDASFAHLGYRTAQVSMFASVLGVMLALGAIVFSVYSYSNQANTSLKLDQSQLKAITTPLEVISDNTIPISLPACVSTLPKNGSNTGR